MNMFFAIFFCACATAAAFDDGQWRGEGLLESQGGLGLYGGIGAIGGGPGYGYAGLYHHGGAPLGHDGRVVDTKEVAHAKIQHYAAYKNAAKENGVLGGFAGQGGFAGPIGFAGQGGFAGIGGFYGHGAPLGHDGRVVDTPEVAHAKAAHFAAKAAATHGAFY